MSLAEVTYCLNSTSNGRDYSPSAVVRTPKQPVAKRLVVLGVSLICLSITVCIHEGLIPFSLFLLCSTAWVVSLAGICLMFAASTNGFGDRVVQLSVLLIALLNGAYWYMASLGTFGTSAAATFSEMGYGFLPGVAVLMAIGRVFCDGSPRVSLGATLLLMGLAMGNVCLLAVAYASV